MWGTFMRYQACCLFRMPQDNKPDADIQSSNYDRPMSKQRSSHDKLTTKSSDLMRNLVLFNKISPTLNVFSEEVQDMLLVVVYTLVVILLRILLMKVQWTLGWTAGSAMAYSTLQRNPQLILLRHRLGEWQRHPPQSVQWVTIALVAVFPWKHQ